MKEAYPIIMSKGKEYIIVYVPDFAANTQGKTVAEAMEMARDLIGILGIDMQDDNKELPKATAIEDIHSDNGVVTLVDIDFDEYRKKNEMRSRNRYFDVVVKNSVQIGLVTMPRVCGRRQRGSWDTLHPSGLKCREA